MGDFFCSDAHGRYVENFTPVLDKASGSFFLNDEQMYRTEKPQGQWKSSSPMASSSQLFLLNGKLNKKEVRYAITGDVSFNLVRI
jgi:hypothetical protein